MEVILREDVPDLGIIGDIVTVKPGFARNFLLPRGFAVPANRRNLREFEHQQEVIALKKSRERGSFEALAHSLDKMALEIEARAGKAGRLFGSVTNMDIHRALAEKGFDLDRRRIVVKEPIKAIGDYTVTLKVGHEITTDITVHVKPLGGELVDEDAEARAAAEASVNPTYQGLGQGYRDDYDDEGEGGYGDEDGEFGERSGGDEAAPEAEPAAAEEAPKSAE